MIRLATESDFALPVTDEARLRIYAWRQAYGLDVTFIRYYTDGEGGLFAAMDGVGLFSPADTMSEEWAAFLSMYPDIHTLRCPGGAGELLADVGRWSMRRGEILKFSGQQPGTDERLCHTPDLSAVYALLARCFDTMPPFEAWYPDVSHRMRHGCCRISCVADGGRIVSTAMTVAQAEGHILLGQVATHPDYRCRGYAAACLRDLICRCKGDKLYIIPANDTARRLYISLGFQPCGIWAEFVKTP